MQNKGLIIILSGPSGVGKGTIREELMKINDLNLFYSVSMTTRKPRLGEINGREYYFVSNEEFQSNIDSGNLLEWAEYVGNRYGTPKDKIEEKRNQKKNVLVEIEVNGASQVFKKLSGDDGLLSIYIAPPSFEELEKRIRGRSTETDEVVKNRLKKAKVEYEFRNQYQYIVINDDLNVAVDKIKNIILKRFYEVT